jgi:SAM-dependent methyltransferase
MRDRSLRAQDEYLRGEKLWGDDFDCVTSFGVLHHIANVSTVIREASRLLKPGGIRFCREPIVSQGDWRKERPGLTKNGRGIPIAILRRTAREAGFMIKRKMLFDFVPLQRAMYNLGISASSRKWSSRIDVLVSRMFSFRTRYHRPGFFEKFEPALALTLRMPARA